jgi:hypothetical protein
MANGKMHHNPLLSRLSRSLAPDALGLLGEERRCLQGGLFTPSEQLANGQRPDRAGAHSQIHTASTYHDMKKPWPFSPVALCRLSFNSVRRFEDTMHNPLLALAEL